TLDIKIDNQSHILLITKGAIKVCRRIDSIVMGCGVSPMILGLGAVKSTFHSPFSEFRFFRRKLRIFMPHAPHSTRRACWKRADSG
ncbi:hypothetical protein MJI95_35415, partial [Salmonella enterica subsp. enterica serovar Kentucky]|nr:hypothetical protein [Salmonella enterica subsp. enterica serovar Kentucky]